MSGSHNSRLFRAGQWLAATVLPAGTFAAARADASRHPVVAILTLCLWEGAVLFSGFAVKIYRKLEELWVDRAAEAGDALAQRALSRYGRHYRRFVSRIHHDVDVRGLSTWGMYALAMEQVFVDLAVVPRAAGEVPAGPINETAADDGPVRRTVWDLLEQYPKDPLAASSEVVYDLPTFEWDTGMGTATA